MSNREYARNKDPHNGPGHWQGLTFCAAHPPLTDACTCLQVKCAQPLSMYLPDRAVVVNVSTRKRSRCGCMYQNTRDKRLHTRPNTQPTDARVHICRKTSRKTSRGPLPCTSACTAALAARSHRHDPNKHTITRPQRLASPCPRASGVTPTASRPKPCPRPTFPCSATPKMPPATPTNQPRTPRPTPRMPPTWCSNTTNTNRRWGTTT